jgi:hypothetical protein
MGYVDKHKQQKAVVDFSREQAAHPQQRTLYGERSSSGETQMTETEKKDEWQLKGWLGLSKSGKVITVKLGEDMVGMVQKKQLEAVLDGSKQGAPIKLPPAE